MNNTVYQIITDRVIALLQKGVAPWSKPWQGAGSSPRNLISKKPYRGVNSFVLGCSGFSSPFWLSYKQASEMGGNVKRGEKSTPVVFWRWLEKEESDGSKSKIPLLRYFSVFNAEQCEGLKLPELVKSNHCPIESAEAIVASMPKKPEVKHGGDRAFYSPGQDFIGIPNAQDFKSPAHYYCTLFHELGHSTGHESRLNRKGVAGTEGNWSAFGSETYAKEELVAEMVSAFLCGESGVESTIEHSAAYLASWLERLQNDCKLIVFASAQAQKAADYILNRKFEQAE